MPSFACKDIGISCPWWAEENTEDELLKKIWEHLAKSHGMKKLPREMVEKIQKAIIK